MYTKKVYRALDMIMWTRYKTLFFIALGTSFLILYKVLDLDWMVIPWTPIAIIGTAVAFVIGVQNNAAYGRIFEFSFLELEGIIKDLFIFQRKSERIKNFPYPRHFPSLNHYFIWTFVFLLPLGMIPQFAEIRRTFIDSPPFISKYFIWSAIPFYAMVAWIFHTMERIGRTGENPFEGSANDAPISTIARGIEIDLRQNLGEPKEKTPI